MARFLGVLAAVHGAWRGASGGAQAEAEAEAGAGLRASLDRDSLTGDVPKREGALRIIGRNPHKVW